MAKLVDTTYTGVEHTVKLTDAEYKLIGSLLKLVALGAWGELDINGRQVYSVFGVSDEVSSPIPLEVTQFGAIAVR